MYLNNFHCLVGGYNDTELSEIQIGGSNIFILFFILVILFVVGTVVYLIYNPQVISSEAPKTDAPASDYSYTNAQNNSSTNAPVATQPVTNAPVTTALNIDAPIFYTNINYGGTGYKLSAGQHNINSMKIPNDTLSSVRIPKGFIVKLFEHSDFKGRTISLTQDTANLDSLNFNRLTSSIIVTKI